MAELCGRIIEELKMRLRGSRGLSQARYALFKKNAIHVLFRIFSKNIHTKRIGAWRLERRKIHQRKFANRYSKKSDGIDLPQEILQKDQWQS